MNYIQNKNWQTRQFHVLGNSPPNLWERGSKISKAREFIFVPYLAPTLMVTVLLSPTGVATRSSPTSS